MRHRFDVLLLGLLGCARAPRPEQTRSEPSAETTHASAADAAISATASDGTAAPPAAPVASTRDVPFDGGLARIESNADGSEVVRVLDADGGVLSESHCLAPRAGYDAVRDFYTRVRAAILAGDPEQVADLMAFPLRVNDETTRVVKNRTQFLSEYARILTRDVVERVRRAEPAHVFCNAQGEMLGDGVLWAELQPNERLAVWVVNVDTAAPRRKR